MAVDGEARYEGLSGADLLGAFESIERQRFPLNYASLRREIAARGPLAIQCASARHFARFENMPEVGRRALVKVCMRRALVLLLQYNLLMGFLVGFGLSFRGSIFKRAGVPDADTIAKGLIAISSLALLVASYWAFLKWLLLARVGPFTFALLRESTETPNNRVERTREP